MKPSIAIFRQAFPAFFALAVLALLAGCAARLEKPSSLEDWRALYQPALEEDEAALLVQGPGFHDALLLALQRNPGIEAARQRWLAAIYLEPQESSPPDPMIEAGFQIDAPGAGMNRQWNLGLGQELPWWRKLWGRMKRAAVEADIARLRYEIAVRDLIIETKDACYEWYYLGQAIRITGKIEELLKNEAILAYVQLSTGRTQLNEAFRAESQAAQLAYDRLLLEEQRVAQSERLRSLLNLPPRTPIGPIAAAPVYKISDDWNLLYERAETWSQVLRIRGLEVEKARYETYLARLERFPNLSLGWMYQANVPGMMGDSMHMGLGAVNLPIWEPRNRAMIREKQALGEAMKREALEETNSVRRAAAQACFEVALTGRLVQLYRETLLPQAEAVMHRVEIDFRADLAAFSSVLETTMAYHNFLLAFHRAVADHGQAIGRLEMALGTTAEPRGPVAAGVGEHD